MNKDVCGSVVRPVPPQCWGEFLFSSHFRQNNMLLTDSPRLFFPARRSNVWVTEHRRAVKNKQESESRTRPARETRGAAGPCRGLTSNRSGEAAAHSHCTGGCQHLNVPRLVLKGTHTHFFSLFLAAVRGRGGIKN